MNILEQTPKIGVVGRVTEPRTIIKFISNDIDVNYVHFIKTDMSFKTIECAGDRCVLCAESKILFYSNNPIEKDRGQSLFRKQTIYADVKLDDKIVKFKLPKSVYDIIVETIGFNDFNKFRVTGLINKRFVIIMRKSFGDHFPVYDGYFLNRNNTKFKGRPR